MANVVNDVKKWFLSNPTAKVGLSKLMLVGDER
jgi:hypothetical protein